MYAEKKRTELWPISFSCVYSDSYNSAWPSSIQHDRGNTHISALPCQWSTHPRHHLGQGSTDIVSPFIEARDKADIVLVMVHRFPAFKDLQFPSLHPEITKGRQRETANEVVSE